MTTLPDVPFAAKERPVSTADQNLERAYDRLSEARKAMDGVEVASPEGRELLRAWRDATADVIAALKVWREARQVSEQGLAA